MFPEAWPRHIQPYKLNQPYKPYKLNKLYKPYKPYRHEVIV